MGIDIEKAFRLDTIQVIVSARSTGLAIFFLVGFIISGSSVLFFFPSSTEVFLHPMHYLWNAAFFPHRCR